jgi:hypothetical protein
VSHTRLGDAFRFAIVLICVLGILDLVGLGVLDPRGVVTSTWFRPIFQEGDDQVSRKLDTGVFHNRNLPNFRLPARRRNQAVAAVEVSPSWFSRKRA